MGGGLDQKIGRLGKGRRTRAAQHTAVRRRAMQWQAEGWGLTQQVQQACVVSGRLAAAAAALAGGGEGGQQEGETLGEVGGGGAGRVVRQAPGEGGGGAGRQLEESRAKHLRQGGREEHGRAGWRWCVGRGMQTSLRGQGTAAEQAGSAGPAGGHAAAASGGPPPAVPAQKANRAGWRGRRGLRQTASPEAAACPAAQALPGGRRAAGCGGRPAAAGSRWRGGRAGCEGEKQAHRQGAVDGGGGVMTDGRGARVPGRPSPSLPAGPRHAAGPTCGLEVMDGALGEA